MSDDRIFHCVARVGAMGWLGSFGSIHPIPTNLEHHIVIRSKLGIFLATLSPSSEIGNTPSKSQRTPLVGEVLREADANDLAAVTVNRDWVEQHFNQITQIVGEACQSIAIVDCELTLDRSGLIIWFIGQSTSALGPLTLQIANRWQLDSVQFISEEQVRQWSLTDLEVSPPTTSPQSTAAETVLATDIHTVDWQSVHLEKRQETSRFSKPVSLLLQSHGIYQQKRRLPNRGLHSWPTEHTVMLRIRHHGMGWKLSTIGKLLDLADKHGDGWLRPTVRQGWQIYGITKTDLPEVIQQLNTLFLTTHGACGNYVRNISVCPVAHLASGAERLAFELAMQLEQLLSPRNDSYELVWLSDESDQSDFKSINDDRLPHKFKIGVATSTHCCTEPLSNDLAILLTESSEVLSSLPYVAHIFLGGGLGFRPHDSLTAPRLASYAASIPASDVIPLASGLKEAYRKYAPRRQRKMSRFKYWLAEIGLEELLRLVQQEAPRSIKLLETRDNTVPSTFSHRGEHFVQEKKFHGFSWQKCGLNAHDSLLADWFRKITHDSDHHWYLSSQQEVLLGQTNHALSNYLHKLYPQSIWGQYWLWDYAKTSLTAQENHRPLPTVTACPALPTCGLALADAELHRQSMQTFLEQVAQEFDLELGPFNFRISGCSNNCSRPLLAHLALIAHAPQRYGIYLGGSHSQQRLAEFTGREFSWGDGLFTYIESMLQNVSRLYRSMYPSIQASLATAIDSLPISTLSSIA